MTKIIFPNPTTAVSTGEENLQVCIGRVRPARRPEQRSEAMGGRAGNKYAQIRLRSSVATHVKSRRPLGRGCEVHPMRLSKLQLRLVLVAKRRHPAPPVLGGNGSLAQVSQRMHILQLRETLWDKCGMSSDRPVPPPSCRAAQAAQTVRHQYLVRIPIQNRCHDVVADKASLPNTRPPPSIGQHSETFISLDSNI
jgi:hypothetical protein